MLWFDELPGKCLDMHVDYAPDGEANCSCFSLVFSLNARWQSKWEQHHRPETKRTELMASMPTAHSLNGDHFWNILLCEKSFFLLISLYSGLSIKRTILYNIWKEHKPMPGPEWILNWCSLDNCISKWWPSLRNDKNPFHFNFNRITQLDIVRVLLRDETYCVLSDHTLYISSGKKMSQSQCIPNVGVCCMNYQWEDGCGLAELKRFRLRCPLTAHWFDISIIDSKGDSDSWAAQSQLFSWFEASCTYTQVEGLVGDY